jgi:lipocalin
MIVAITGCRAQHGDIDRTTVAKLDVRRYMGQWYEIARYDHRFERHLEYCKALYTLMPDGKIVVENSGIDSRSGKRKVALGKAKAGSRSGQLRVSFFLFFYSDYNVLALGDNYDWALVGSKSPKYLWILSRTPSLPESTIEHILTIARERGYDTDKLIWVRQ